jgi:purine nucleoside phosphorylase
MWPTIHSPSSPTRQLSSTQRALAAIGGCGATGLAEEGSFTLQETEETPHVKKTAPIRSFDATPSGRQLCDWMR